MRGRTLFPFASLAAASMWCVVLLVVRKHEYGAAAYKGLVWNLFLAWIPFVVALLVLAAYRRRASSGLLLVLGLVWLVFLPNAPYVFTDFVHLGTDHRLFDTLIIASFSFTSLMLGFGSLLVVQLVVARSAGVATGWLVALVALFLSSVGIYLGRVRRLNSWDVWQRPRLIGRLAHTWLAHPLGDHYLLGFVFGVAGLLTLVYAGVYGFAAFAAAVQRDERRNLR